MNTAHINERYVQLLATELCQLAPGALQSWQKKNAEVVTYANGGTTVQLSKSNDGSLFAAVASRMLEFHSMRDALTQVWEIAEEYEETA